MSGKPLKKIDHIGIAVKDLKQSLHFYTNILGLKLIGFEYVQSEKVNVAFLEISGTRLELLEATCSDSPIAKFIKKKGEGIHHIALQADSVSDYLSYLNKQGIQLIHEVPKLGAHGNLVAFLHTKSSQGVLLELCQPPLTVGEIGRNNDEHASEDR